MSDKIYNLFKLIRIIRVTPRASLAISAKIIGTSLLCTLGGIAFLELAAEKLDLIEPANKDSKKVTNDFFAFGCVAGALISSFVFSSSKADAALTILGATSVGLNFFLGGYIDIEKRKDNNHLVLGAFGTMVGAVLFGAITASQTRG